MIRTIRVFFDGLDLWLLCSVVLLSLMGLATMFTYGDQSFFFSRQIIWIVISIIALLIAFVPDYRFLRIGNATFLAYIVITVILILVLIFGETVKGAQSRFDLIFFSVQPADFAKIILIAILAKYFSKRHMEIGNFTHIFVSGAYTLVLFFLIAIQPDFGSAIILFLVWLGMVLVAGIKFRHLVVVGVIGALALTALWSFGFQDYQKERIVTFLHPLADIQGAGYNAYQSTVAVGSGQILGKGIGYGTQSKLQFLPEWETDFIFAAFAEEWGLIGVLVLFVLFSIVIWRLLYHAMHGATNFERLFSAGVSILFISHFFVHIGMNIGLLPVTGTTIPFLSYGGSHLLTEFIAIGMVMAMSRYSKSKYVAHDIVN